MANPDIRHFLEALDKKGELTRVPREVAPRFEIAAVTKKVIDQNGPALLFENIKGHPDWKVVTNLVGSRGRAALAIDSTAERSAQDYLDKTKNLLPTRLVMPGQAPVKERIARGKEIDLGDLPVMTHFEEEPPFITIGIAIARDPDTGKHNWSVHRIEVKGRDKTGILISPKHLWLIHRKAEDRGQLLPIAISLGNHPADLVAALSMVTYGVEESQVAGALRGEPLEVVKGETVDLEVPAQAEAVIEGFIPPGVREEEGPFAEFTGYYAQKGPRPIIQVTAITRRNEPIYHGLLEGGVGLSSRHLATFGREGLILEAARQVTPHIKAVNCSTPVGSWCVISMRKEREGEQRNVMAAALSVDPYIKQVMVVDEDVDLFDAKEILWAISYRVRPDKGITIVPGMWLSVLDPNSDKGTSGKVLIDATMPLGKEKAHFRRAHIPQEIMDKIRLEDYLASL